MNTEIAKTIAAFLSRVELKGAEVPAYNACLAALQRIVDEQPESTEVYDTAEETVEVEEATH